MGRFGIDLKGLLGGVLVIGFLACGIKAQRRAITSVLSQASGKSAKSARISAAGRK